VPAANTAAAHTKATASSCNSAAGR
jgi:hypothetical protein